MVRVLFEINGIQKNGGADNCGLLGGCRVLGEGALECLAVRKGFRHQALWLLEDLSNVISTVGVGHIVGEQMEWLLAATLSTAGIALGETIDTHSTTASRLMQFVHTGSIMIVNVVFGDAVKIK